MAQPADGILCQGGRVKALVFGLAFVAFSTGPDFPGPRRVTLSTNGIPGNKRVFGFDALRLRGPSRRVRRQSR